MISDSLWPIFSGYDQPVITEVHNSDIFYSIYRLLLQACGPYWKQFYQESYYFMHR